MTRHIAVGVAAVLVALAGFLLAVDPPKEVETKTTTTRVATIEAIDAAARNVTLKYDDGTLGNVHVPQEVKRFDVLKVGDRVTFTYEDSVVYRIQKPRTKSRATESKSTTVEPGDKLAGTKTQVLVTSVKVEAIDLAAPSITVSAADGSRQTFPIKDKANLAGVKVGDKIEITYTQAIMVSVEPAAQ